MMLSPSVWSLPRWARNSAAIPTVYLRASASAPRRFTITRTECVDQCRLLLVAGNVTTTDLICNGVKAFLDHPDQLRVLRNSPEFIANAVEEVLRYDGSVTNTGRVVNRDMQIGGCPVRKGESLHLSPAAARCGCPCGPGLL